MEAGKELAQLEEGRRWSFVVGRWLESPNLPR
jgi:hypothetical protein